MNWLTKLFSAGASTLVDSLGTAVDKLVTSDEERLKMKATILKEVNRHKKEQLEAISTYDKEITSRHAADMKSDNWLSKSVRPLILVFLTVATVVLAYMTIFTLDEARIAIIDPWVDLLKVLLITAYSFYFGSRGFEKVQNIKEKKP